jgi:hypothetical protein
MNAKLLRFNEAYVYQKWDTIPRALKSEATRWVYLAPNGSRWDLHGRHEGRQGARLNKELQGAYHLPFDHLLTEGAYQVGATYERSNINKRIISFGIILGGPKYPSHAYRMIEANWWDAWPHDTQIRWVALGASPARGSRQNVDVDGPHSYGEQRHALGHEDSCPKTVVCQADSVGDVDCASGHG